MYHLGGGEDPVFRTCQLSSSSTSLSLTTTLKKDGKHDYLVHEILVLVYASSDGSAEPAYSSSPRNSDARIYSVGT